MNDFKIGDRVEVNCKAHWAHGQQGEVIAFDGSFLAKVKLDHYGTLYLFLLLYLVPVAELAPADTAPTPARTLDSVTEEEARGLFVAAFGWHEVVSEAIGWHFYFRAIYEDGRKLLEIRGHNARSGEGYSLDIYENGEVRPGAFKDIAESFNAAALTDALRALGVWQKPENR